MTRSGKRRLTQTQTDAILDTHTQHQPSPHETRYTSGITCTCGHHAPNINRWWNHQRDALTAHLHAQML